MSFVHREVYAMTQETHWELGASNKNRTKKSIN